MEISGKNAAMAIIKIFDDHRVRDGGRLMVSDIATEWKATGLRKSDIVEGIREGIELGSFALEQTGDGPLLTLLNRLAVMKGKGANDLERTWDSARALATKIKAAKRKPSPAPPASERRHKHKPVR